MRKKRIWIPSVENYKIKENHTGYVFFLIFLLLTAGIITGAYFVYKNYEKNFRSEVENQISAVAELKVNQLVQWRKERLGDGQVFFKNEMFSVIVKRYIQNRNDRNAEKGILAWARQVQSAYGYDHVMLLDAKFNTVFLFPDNKKRAHLIIDKKNTEVVL